MLRVSEDLSSLLVAAERWLEETAMDSAASLSFKVVSAWVLVVASRKLIEVPSDILAESKLLATLSVIAETICRESASRASSSSKYATARITAVTSAGSLLVREMLNSMSTSLCIV